MAELVREREALARRRLAAVDEQQRAAGPRRGRRRRRRRPGRAPRRARRRLLDRLEQVGQRRRRGRGRVARAPRARAWRRGWCARSPRGRVSATPRTGQPRRVRRGVSATQRQRKESACPRPDHRPHPRTTTSPSRCALGEPDVPGAARRLPALRPAPRARLPSRSPRAAAHGVDDQGARAAARRSTTCSCVNPTDKPVLLYEGEEVLGAQQNRTFDVSVLVAAGASCRCPVSCVEARPLGRRAPRRGVRPGARRPPTPRCAG